MKDLGRTQDGEFIVVMTVEEHRSIAILHAAMSGMATSWSDTYRMYDGTLNGLRMDEVFKAIAAWVGFKFGLNECLYHIKAAEELAKQIPELKLQ